MKKVIIVPHTHWDREWYFSEQTSNVLLNRLKEDIINAPKNFPFELDGQASLLEKFVPQNQVQQFLKDHQVVAGPLYVQQDTFNVLLGTTLNNLELGKRTLQGRVSKTIYMPDTFGFNAQLPQIFSYYGFENFVFWRGIKPEDRIKSNLFQWEGYDGSKVKATVLSEGYYCMGQYFPYNQESDYQVFTQELINYVHRLETKSKQNVWLVPLGGDQAPYEHDVTHALAYANAHQSEYQFELGCYQDYFTQVEASDIPTINYELNYSGTSKIHRTIHSNRYDLKKSFRDLEIAIYYQLEPLEIIYHHMGGKLISQSQKDQHIYGPLLKSSAHDSLGGCNVDQTNDEILVRNQATLNYVNSYLDLMMRDIKEFLKLKPDQYLVFNLAPFTRNLSFHTIVSNDQVAPLGTADGQVFEYNQVDLSFDHNHQVINHYLSFNLQALPPLSFKIIDLKTIAVPTLDATLKPLNLKLKVETDLGDEFDFAYGSPNNAQYYQDFELISSCGFADHNVKRYQLPTLNLTLWAFETKDSTCFEIKLHNQLHNQRVSLVFPMHQKPLLSRHLALIEQTKDQITNWKQLGYKDNPLNFFANDGLIANGKTNILTKGNNEVYLGDSHLELTLYRAIGMMGKPNLSTRPGSASGLGYKVWTPKALLAKELTFDLALSSQSPTAALNNWYFQPLGIYGQSHNVNLNLVSRFEINQAQLHAYKYQLLTKSLSQHLIGRLKLNSSKTIELVYTSPQASSNRERIYYETI